MASNSTSSPATWLITGASSGFGKALAIQALGAGHKVVGSSRDIKRASDSFPEFVAQGGTWLELDPGKPDTYELLCEVAQTNEVDVLVNNAGYAFIGAVEDTSEQELREQMEVNFYGPVRAVRAFLPGMRARRRGHIVLVSSGAGFIARPGRANYSASKFAVEAIHESLSLELQTFGIKVLIVEPGAFRTPFSERIITPARYDHSDGLSDPYRGTATEPFVVGSRGINSIPDFVKGDPDKGARAILRAVDEGHDYLRLILGKDCVEALDIKIAELQSDLDKTRAIAMNVDVD